MFFFFSKEEQMLNIYVKDIFSHSQILFNLDFSWNISITESEFQNSVMSLCADDGGHCMFAVHRGKACFCCSSLFFFLQVRAGESLQKLVSDMKEFLILNDFPSVNTSITERSNALQEISNHTDQQLLALKQELAVNLCELEQAYYSSSYR